MTIKKAVVTESQSRRLQLTPKDKVFLEKLYWKESDFIDNAAYETRKDFHDPIPDIVPDISWYYQLMGSMIGSKRINIIRPGELRLLTKHEEKEMFILYNWYRRSICEFQSNWWKKNRPSLTDNQVKKIVELNRLSLGMEERICSFNVGLIVSVAKKFRGDLTDTEMMNLMSDGSEAMVYSIRKFDASRGYKFSTYFCQAAWKKMWRQLSRSIKIRTREVTTTRLGGLAGDSDSNFSFNRNFYCSDESLENQSHFERIRIVNKAMNGCSSISIPKELRLSDDEKEVIMARFSSSECRRKKPTLDMLAEALSKTKGHLLTRERIRQILDSGLGKLKQIVEEYENPMDERENGFLGFEIEEDHEYSQESDLEEAFS